MKRINEIFYSLQGEGFHTGTPAVFVRFSGCNLQCHFCDTDHRKGTVMSEAEIIGAVMQHPAAPLLVLTGGEPSLFVDHDIIEMLKRATGKFITIETNGTNPLPGNIDWVTLSPKGAYEGGDTFPLAIDRCDELKVVYTGQPLEPYFKINARHRFLQPCYCADEALRRQNLAATIQAVLDDPRWRLSLQTHRYLNIR